MEKLRSIDFEPTPYRPACSTCDWEGEESKTPEDAQDQGHDHVMENPDHKVYTIGGIGHHPV